MSEARAKLATRAGVVLLGLSVALWVPLPVIPFLPLSVGAKSAWAGGFIIAAEVAFWSGAALAGPEAARRFRSWFRRLWPSREEPKRKAPRA